MMNYREWRKSMRAIKAQQRKVRELRLRLEALARSQFSDDKNKPKDAPSWDSELIPNAVRYHYEKERVELEVMLGMVDDIVPPSPPWHVRLWHAMIRKRPIVPIAKVREKKQ